MVIMLPQPENRGGLLGQLRDYALMGSDSGAWANQVEQTSSLSRSVSLQGEVNDIVHVNLTAKKQLQRIGSRGIRTFYTLKAMYTQEDLHLDFLPKNVVEILRRKKVKVGEVDENEESEEVVLLVNEDDQVDEHEFDGYDEMRFRHLRSVEYRLDGNGSLLDCTRKDVYEDGDEGGVDILNIELKQAGSHIDEEKDILSLEGWGKNPEIENTTELVLHPRLQKLIAKEGARALEEAINFYELVQEYNVDKKLLSYTRLEHQRAMLTLLAFLRMEANTKDVLDLI